MGGGTKIEWADETWNVVTGCSVVSPGCTHCYAMRWAGASFLKDHWSRAGLTEDSRAGPVWTGEVRWNEPWLDKPLRWTRPRRIFVVAHGDLFHENVPREWIVRVWAVMKLAPHHTFQVLTKRAARLREILSDPEFRLEVERECAAMLGRRKFSKKAPGLHPSQWETSEGRVRRAAFWPLPNVHVGISAEDQTRLAERWFDLALTPAAVRFISAEPLLGRLDITRVAWNGRLVDISVPSFGLPPVDWIIVGGESGPGARPMHPAWVRDLRDRCSTAVIPLHFKQWGDWLPGEYFPPGAGGGAFGVNRRQDGVEGDDWDEPKKKKRGQYACWDGEDGLHYDTALDDGAREAFLERYGRPSAWAFRIGKEKAGRHLDGKLHDGMPAMHDPFEAVGEAA